MNLIPFSKQYLRINEALPFGVREASGRLLLGAGASLDSPQLLEQLQATELFADEAESSEWRKRLSATVDAMIRQNHMLHRIADARPDGAAAAQAAASHKTLPEQWTELTLALEALLREARVGEPWLARVQPLSERIHKLAYRRLDAALYHLIFSAGHCTANYSASHGVLCLLMAGEAARMLDWNEALVTSTECAALTMNVAMRRLQDLLAANDAPVTPQMRQAITNHPISGAQLLVASGCDDKVWVEAVRLHHDDSQRDKPLALLSQGQQAARLLRRVDIFSAKLSRRANRMPMSPVQAAREACLGSSGKPDEIGGALLKAVGLYPPGSFVELASAEQGIVFARGSRANQPVVAAIVNASGAPISDPVLRDTADVKHAIKGALSVKQVRVSPPHERILALR